MQEETNNTAGFITKASAYYCDKFFLRATIQCVPGIGGALDTLLSGLGAKYQHERLKDFVLKLQNELSEIAKEMKIKNIEPGEELFDFIIQVFNQVIQTRSEEKRKRFASLVAKQIIYPKDWDEAEAACRFIGELTDLHIKVLEITLNAPVCDGDLKGKRIIMFSDIPKDKKFKIPPTDVRSVLNNSTNVALEVVKSELVTRGLLSNLERVFWSEKERGLIRPEIFVATDLAKWLMKWICSENRKKEQVDHD